MNFFDEMYLCDILEDVRKLLEVKIELRPWHRWELLSYYHVFTVVMVIYHYVDIIWRILVTPNFCIKYTIMNNCYPGERVNMHIQ